MNTDLKRDLGLVATQALNQLKGLSAGDCFKLIRDFTGSSYASLIRVLTQASKLEIGGAFEAQLVFKLSMEINRLNKSLDLDRALLVVIDLHSDVRLSSNIEDVESSELKLSGNLN